MLLSENIKVRQFGGQMAALAAIEWNDVKELDAVLDGNDSAAREGAARVAANRLPNTVNAETAAATLLRLFNDPADEVRTRRPRWPKHSEAGR